MTDVAAYPQFSELRKEHKPLFDRIFRDAPPQISEFTFTNLFAWRSAYGLEASRFGDAVLLRMRDAKGVRFLPPLSKKTGADAMRRLLDETGIPFVRVPEPLAAQVGARGGIRITPDRDNADYLYSMKDLVSLAGRRYDGKRNLIKRFKSSNTYTYMELTADNVRACLPFQEAWCVMKDCDENEGLRNERTALGEMIDQFGDFGLLGGAITIGAEVQAFVIAEPLNPETLVIHMLKAEPAVTGLYQTILNEFLQRHTGRFSLVNMEQDLGLPGLRKAKKSYYPLSLVSKNTVAPVP